MRFAKVLSAALFFLLASSTPSRATEYSLDGGAHIWIGQQWLSFRAHVGPRWGWDWFSLHPNGAIGVAFVDGTDNKATFLGGYLDADVSIPLSTRGRYLQIGPGAGVGYIMGLGGLTQGVIPQAYGQVAYRWDENLVGLMAIGGREYERPSHYPTGFPAHVNFSGIGLRFEYQIDRPTDDDDDSSDDWDDR